MYTLFPHRRVTSSDVNGLLRLDLRCWFSCVVLVLLPQWTNRCNPGCTDHSLCLCLGVLSLGLRLLHKEWQCFFVFLYRVFSVCSGSFLKQAQVLNAPLMCYLFSAFFSRLFHIYWKVEVHIVYKLVCKWSFLICCDNMGWGGQRKGKRQFHRHWERNIMIAMYSFHKQTAKQSYIIKQTSCCDLCSLGNLGIGHFSLCIKI